jgi:hypothetical protein
VIDLKELKRDAVAQIQSAFPVAEPPSFADMRNDHCLECQETVALFAGKRWPEVMAKDLTGNPVPGFLTDIGVRYYLPAMMLRSLESERELDCFPDSVVGLLSPAGGKPNKHTAAWLSGHTRGQVRAILAFLRYREGREKVDRSEADWPADWILAVPAGRVVTRAIEYWEKQLAKRSLG